MAEKNLEIIAEYFKQQSELGMPDYIVDSNAMPPANGYHAAPNSSPSLAGSGPVGDSYEAKRQALVELYRATENCQNCPLGALRTKYVFGAGNAGAPLMIIGEAPGEDEDRQGMPFVGAAGQLLTKMLAAIKLDRKNDVFITNILKCRPPGNRNPNNDEARACAPILNRQIDIISPKVILLLGRVAAFELLGIAETIAKLRGQKLDYKGIPVFVTYHPAALLRNAQYKRPAWDDLQKLDAFMKEQ